MLGPMNLGKIAALLETDPGGQAELPVRDLAYDSRKVTPGCVFFCVVGKRHDGHDFASQAVKAGAAALVVERGLEVGVPQLLVTDARAAMGKVAAPFFGDPSRKLRVVGITGTNGKTTVCHLLESIVTAAGDGCGVIGTIDWRVPGERRPARRSTPEAIDLQRALNAMVEKSAEVAAVEATSIGIDQKRMEGTFFEVAVFTNLTRDHLDHHESMENYFASKRRLFEVEKSGSAVVNVDDEWGRKLLEDLPLEVLTYGVSPNAAIRASEIRRDHRSSRFRLRGDGFDLRLEVPLPGAFNVSNALAAAAAGRWLGYSPEIIAAGIERLPAIPGRFEFVDEGQPFEVVVDFAHTPDGLARVLEAAREIAGEFRVIAVFGAEGDSDRGKRPLMGEAVARHSDLAVITSDNPMSEDPGEIIKELEAGMRPAAPQGGYWTEPDRRRAIAGALAEAAPGDVVVICGKGHERSQKFADREVAFDDREVASELLRERVRAGGGGV